jgi:phosphomevalonate kinase
MQSDSSTTTTATTTVSAPGKVLLVGGYLVLESGNLGLVVAADKRFYSTVESSRSGSNGTNPQNTSTIVVTSPQFHASWTYTLILGSEEDNVNFLESDEMTLVPSSDENGTASGENPFVEKTLRVVWAYLFQRIRDKRAASNSDSTTPFMFPTLIHITIKADNDFYSVIPHLHGRARTPDNVDALPKFLNCPLDPTTGKAIVNKTGLGSSAALVTSLVGSLFYHFQKDISSCGGIGGSRHSSADNQDPNEDDEEEEELDAQEIIHNLAQLCHCHAQGKVGSGFDVSAAIYGTHIYRRFPKCVLPDVMNQLSPESNHHHLCSHNDPTTNVTGSTAQLVTNVVHSTWSNDMQTPLILPKGLQLMLADVCGGSESPSMASKVLTWKQQHIQQGTMQVPHWSDLKHLNARFVELIQTLSAQTIDKAALSQILATEWSDGDETSATSLLRQLHDTLLQIRTELRQLGEAANVPIEPPEQTELCDATMLLPGVVATIVPGAGGYDAVACLFIDTPQVRSAIGHLWETWNKNGQMICPLAVHASNVGLQLEDP